MEALFGAGPTNFTAEYIWIDENNNLRSKNRTIWEIFSESMDPDYYPVWNFDGSSTNKLLCASENHEIILIPRAIFKDPYQLTPGSKLVLCDCYEYDENVETQDAVDPFADVNVRFPQSKPISINTREPARKIFEKVKDKKPWFGLEQEYVLYSRGGEPLGWKECIENNGGKMPPQGKYYCSVGSDRALGRKIVDEHYARCLSAGVKISGTNAEVMPSQWEFQIGPCEGIEGGDHLWIARYILCKVCEYNNIMVSFDPKPERGWNGSGCHINFSSEEMRGDDGIEHIYKAIDKLKEKHAEHLNVYGNNEHRLVGGDATPSYETSSKDKFTWGVSDRTASVRIPLLVHIEKKGYFEDRRPASDVDPYLATAKLAETTLLVKN